MDQPNNAHIVWSPAILFSILTPLVVIARFYSRLRFTNSLGADDWTILGSLVFSMLVSVLLLAGMASPLPQFPTPGQI